MIWRRGCAAVLFDRFPSTLDYPSARPAQLLRDAGMDVHIIDTGADRPGRKYEGCVLWEEPSHRAAAARILRLRPTVLFAEGATWTLEVLPLARRAWVRFTAMPVSPLKRFAQQVLLPRAAAVSFGNPHHHSLFRIPPNHYADLPYPVNIAFWSTEVARDRAFWTARGLRVPGGAVVAYVAQITEGKRQPEMVRDLVPLLRDRPEVTVVLAGYVVDEHEAAAVREIIAREGLGESVVMLGGISQEDVRQLFAWTTIHIVNSAHETQCMSLYESLAAGVPTIVSDIPELTTAFPGLLRHATGTELRENVDRLLGSPGLGITQVSAARARLDWADVRRHDLVFSQTLKSLLA